MADPGAPSDAAQDDSDETSQNADELIDDPPPLDPIANFSADDIAPPSALSGEDGQSENLPAGGPETFSRALGATGMRVLGATAQELAHAAAPRWSLAPYYPMLQAAAASRQAEVQAGTFQHGLSGDALAAHQRINADLAAGKISPGQANYLHQTLRAVQSGQPLPARHDFTGDPPESSSLYALSQRLDQYGQSVAPSPQDQAAHPKWNAGGNLIPHLVPAPFADASEARQDARARGASPEEQDRVAQRERSLGVLVALAPELRTVLGPVAKHAEELVPWAKQELKRFTSSLSYAPTASEMRAFLAEQFENLSSTLKNRFNFKGLINGLRNSTESGRDIDLLSREGLERHAHDLGIRFDAETSDDALREAVIPAKTKASASYWLPGEQETRFAIDRERVAELKGEAVPQPIDAGEAGSYPMNIKQNTQTLPARRQGPGFWTPRMRQSDPAVDAYERKINPNNESYYVPLTDGSYMQFENATGRTVQDGKLVSDPVSSFYRDLDRLPFARANIIKTASQQVKAASRYGLSVEWLVSEQPTVAKLRALFEEQNIPVKVTYFPQ